ITNLQQFTYPTKEIAYTHSIYSYPAKFTSYLPRELIKTFSKENNLVCDPFSGGGTVGLESMLLNRKFIGYDLNPFAIFLSKVKTSFISFQMLKDSSEELLQSFRDEEESKIDILDPVDKKCLGEKISQEINILNHCIQSETFNKKLRNFFKLALIHSIKIVGRRDFEQRKDWKSASLLPIFKSKVNKMAKKISSLPDKVSIKPEFYIGSNHQMEIPADSVDLIITSPPYLDIDIEYQQIQIQRPSLNKSKRSNVINHILSIEKLPKSELCWTGGNGSVYWENLKKSIAECHRILKNGAFLCLWTGYKGKKNETRLIELIDEFNFDYGATIPIKLSNNRAASSRSTHHSRKTGMLSQDKIFFLLKGQLVTNHSRRVD
ncbi:MAG: DNA methyltransferase, partial [Candidatus Hodarchaeales archaeon]